MEDDKAVEGQVRSVIRAIRVLNCISKNDLDSTLSNISSELHLAPSTTHRLLTTMETEKFVTFDTITNTWKIGVAAFRIGAKFEQGRDIINLSRPYLRRIVSLTGETANIFLENNSRMICVSQWESKHAMRAITLVGGSVESYCSAAGKVILAFKKPLELDDYFANVNLVSYTKNTIVTRRALISEFKNVVSNGYAYDFEEHSDGLSCVAIGIFNENSLPIAAISVSGPTIRMSEKKIIEVSDILIAISIEITTEYGGIIPVLV